MDKQKTSLFYKSKPLFGIDIGNGSVKIAQVDATTKKAHLQAYGTVFFDPKAIQNGIIVNFDILQKAIQDLLNDHLTGSVTSHSVAASLPVLHSFTRIVNLPPLEGKDVFEAVRTEAEQYIPIPINDLYLDYQVVEKSVDVHDYLVAAVPKKVADSYLELFNRLQLQLVCLEPSILSVARIVQHAEVSNIPTLVIDAGSNTTDLIIFNKSSVRVTGTIKFGGETLTQAITEKFSIPYEEAARMKGTHGLDPGPEQGKMVSALAKSMQFLTAEINKIIRYYEERDKNQQAKVEQIIILGGGANLPGISTYLTSELRIPTRLADIWQNTNPYHISPPSSSESIKYATAAGLAIINPKEAVK
jgi:type IV pilus assembly protein PilM